MVVQISPTLRVIGFILRSRHIFIVEDNIPTMMIVYNFSLMPTLIAARPRMKNAVIAP